MKKVLAGFLRKRLRLIIFSLGIISVIIFNYGLQYSSSNEFCESCHVHPQATQSWRMGAHFDNESGVVVACVDCHLPPGGVEYLTAKAITGGRDIYGSLFKDTDNINWELKSSRDMAAGHVYEASCLKCHQNLFPRGLSRKGEDAHLYYDRKKEELRCINCHLETGHYHKPVPKLAELDEVSQAGKILYKNAALVDSFINFKETIPETYVDFEMVAIAGGTFKMGSPEDESYRKEDEGPVREVNISPFWMGKLEVSWDEYEAFYKETGGEGRTEDQYKFINQNKNIDAVTGPTPAYGNPDQGWGKGKRPAITMTFYAVQKYCEWLSIKTGKTYRLPTEAEWEYACRANTESPYFFEGDPKQFSGKRFINKIFGADTAKIASHIVYAGSSSGKTQLPGAVAANPFGLKNMLGNVREFCSDFYDPATYAGYGNPETVSNPKGPASGTERVVRGGSYKSDAHSVRSAARDFTRHDAWMVTDPQIPKSLWWYSDCNDVGFRVVCEYQPE